MPTYRAYNGDLKPHQFIIVRVFMVVFIIYIVYLSSIVSYPTDPLYVLITLYLMEVIYNKSKRCRVKANLRKTLIAIIGPVGVGKSTIIKRTHIHLKNKRIPIVTTFLKAFHGPSFLLWQLVVKLIFSTQRFSFSRVNIAPWYLLSRFNREIAWKLTLVTALIDVLFSIPLKLLSIYVRRLVGYNILCEEYLYGALMDYTYTYVNAKVRKGRRILRFAIKSLIVLLLKNKPHITVILDSNIDELFNRWRRRGYGDPQLKYVLFQKTFINKIVTEKLIPLHGFKVSYINTSESNENAIIKLVLEDIIQSRALNN